MVDNIFLSTAKAYSTAAAITSITAGVHTSVAADMVASAGNIASVTPYVTPATTHAGSALADFAKPSPTLIIPDRLSVLSHIA